MRKLTISAFVCMGALVFFQAALIAYQRATIRRLWAVAEGWEQLYRRVKARTL